MPIFEISGFNTGISRAGVTFLEPADSFSEVIDGFVNRQKLQSRLGFQEFATGGIGGYPVVASKGIVGSCQLVTAENVGNSANLAEQTFTLALVPIKESYMIINVTDSGLGAKQIKAKYNGTGWDFSGNYVVGTNTINSTTGAVVVTFDAILTGGDAITVTYQSTVDNSLTAAAAAQQSFTIPKTNLVRNHVIVTQGAKEVNIFAAPKAGTSTATAVYTFCLRGIPLDLSDITISVADSVLGAKEIVASYSGGWSFSGDYNAGGTNTVDETTGAVTVTFDVPLTGGDAISIDYFNNDGIILTGNVDSTLNNSLNWNTGVALVGFDAALTANPLELIYEYYPSLRVMGIFEYIADNEIKELLTFDKDYLYRFDETTNTLQQVLSTSDDPITTFGITGNDDYVSGTDYPDKVFNARFVFTGKGMTDVYFFDGYGIKRFTNAVDNTDYQAFGSPSEVLTRAKHVFFFGERLNFLVPVLDGILYPQGLLFSAIRDSSGKGDKFNTSGAGLINLDTRDYISGWGKVEDRVLITLYESEWVIDKSSDNFNPYIPREISSVFGTDADFATVVRSSKAESLGKLGVIDTDLSTTIRVDDNIPYFTRDEVDPDDIDLTYGGYDEDNSQTLFSYRSNEGPIADTQDRVLTHNWNEKSWSVFLQRFSCYGRSEAGTILAMNQIDENIKDEWIAMDTTEEIMNKLGLTKSFKKTLAGDDNGFVYHINVDYDDYTNRIFDITSASSAVLTLDEHAFQVGDNVKIEQVEGMLNANEENGINSSASGKAFYTVTAISEADSTVTINHITSDLTAYSTGGLISKTIDFSATLNEFNPWRDKGYQCYLKEIEFYLENNGAGLLVDISDSNTPGAYINKVKIEPLNSAKANEYVKLQIENVADFHTIKMTQLSKSNQVIIKSIRILAEQGGFTND